MIRKSGYWHSIVIASCKGNAQNLRSFFGIFEIGFVEITDTHQHHGIRMFLLEILILDSDRINYRLAILCSSHFHILSP